MLMLILMMIGCMIEVKEGRGKITSLPPKTGAIPGVNACFKRSI